MAEEEVKQELNKVLIGGVEYKLSDLSDEAKAQIQSLIFAEAEIKRLKAQLAIAATAKLAYQNALRDLVPKQGS